MPNEDFLTRYKLGRKPDNALPKEKEPEAPDDLDALYTSWKQKPHPVYMRTMVQKLNPTVESALRTYGGQDNPLSRSRARRIAVDAIHSYQPKAGSSLKSWVSLHMQGLQRYNNTLTPIQIPERIRIDNSKIYRAAQEYKAIHGQDPTDEEIFKATGITPKRIQFVRKAVVPVVNEGQYMKDTGDEDDDVYMPGVPNNSWQNVWAEYVYHDLDDIDKRIFDMRMGRGPYKGNPLPVQDIAKKLGMSSPAVSQRSNRIADKMAGMYQVKDAL